MRENEGELPRLSVQIQYCRIMEFFEVTVEVAVLLRLNVWI